MTAVSSALERFEIRLERAIEVALRRTEFLHGLLHPGIQFLPAFALSPRLNDCGTNGPAQQLSRRSNVAIRPFLALAGALGLDFSPRFSLRLHVQNELNRL